MDAGVAAIAAAIISGLASTLTAIVVAQINARSQSDIIQALARTAADRDVGALLELAPAKTSIWLRFLHTIARFLIALLRVLAFIAIVSIGCYIGYRSLPPAERDNLIHASPSTSQEGKEADARREERAERQPDVQSHPDVVEPSSPNGLPLWPVWVVLLSAALAFVVSLRAKRRLDHISAPQLS